METTPAATQPLLSVVIPCFNEQEVIEATHHRLSETLAGVNVRYELIYVDDGSKDGLTCCSKACMRGTRASKY